MLGHFILLLYRFILALSRGVLFFAHVVSCCVVLYTRCVVLCCVVLYSRCVVLACVATRVVLVLCCVVLHFVVLARVVTRVFF